MASRRALVALFLFSWGSIAYQRAVQSSSRAREHIHDGIRSHGGCSNGHRYRFLNYQASSFEVEWKNSVTAGHLDACAFIRSHDSEYRSWLDGIKAFDNFEYSMASPFASDVPLRAEHNGAAHPSQVFSKFTYINICPGEYEGLKREIYVEPLAGHLRHPLAQGVCKSLPDRALPVHVMDVSHIRFNPWGAADFHQNFNGQKYLFDMGTSTFSTSLQYMTTRYQQAGISFDRIWAWEVQAMSPGEYWQSVPDVYKGRIHFYNTPITKNFSDASHPLNIIRSIFQPGDFIAIKLDIDDGPLETAIMKEIESDPLLMSAIAEMMFEQHYDHEDMTDYFSVGNGASLADVTNHFSKLRESGLLLHYWP